jgi:hypothetical protein
MYEPETAMQLAFNEFRVLLWSGESSMAETAKTRFEAPRVLSDIHVEVDQPAGAKRKSKARNAGLIAFEHKNPYANAFKFNVVPNILQAPTAPPELRKTR